MRRQCKSCVHWDRANVDDISNKLSCCDTTEDESWFAMVGECKRYPPRILDERLRIMHGSETFGNLIEEGGAVFFPVTWDMDECGEWKSRDDD
jgi:hypothetical protein